MKFIIEYLWQVSKTIPNTLIRLFSWKTPINVQQIPQPASAKMDIQHKKVCQVASYAVDNSKWLMNKPYKQNWMKNRKRKSFKSFLLEEGSSSNQHQIVRKKHSLLYPMRSINEPHQNLKAPSKNKSKIAIPTKPKYSQLRKSKIIKKRKQKASVIAQDCSQQIKNQIFKNEDGMQISFIIKNKNVSDEVIMQQSDTQLLKFVMSPMLFTEVNSEPIMGNQILRFQGESDSQHHMWPIQ